MLVSYILQNARNKYEGALYCLEYVCSNGQTDVYRCQAKSVMVLETEKENMALKQRISELDDKAVAREKNRG